MATWAGASVCAIDCRGKAWLKLAALVCRCVVGMKHIGEKTVSLYKRICLRIYI